MFTIEFYEDKNGKSEIKDYLDLLLEQSSSNKDSRIQYKQMVRYIELLSENGTQLPKEVTKHLDGEIWELRPGNNRVLYFFYTNNTYVLLHHFRKKTQKTPRREIERALLEMNDYLARKKGL
ncbi:MAG: type II toxin-antitoxin system RelE/ParE family toxin [Eubacterium sp.]|nr:type II toxin-antitoxin system RelE/ParE family toxin [Eubacterium sp.]